MPSILIQAILRAHNAKYEKLLPFTCLSLLKWFLNFFFYIKFVEMHFLYKKIRMKKNCK